MMDPLTAAGAAKALTTTANAASKNTFLQALFMPTAKAYGDHWGAETREKLKRAAAAKKQQNVEAHLLAVQPHVESRFQPDPELTEEWMRGAESVDPVDEELSKAWRATLLAIGRGDPYRKRMLSVVQSMSPDEARAFLMIATRLRRSSILAELSSGPGGYPVFSLNDYRARLEGLGLVRSRWEMLGSPSNRLTFVSVALLILIVFGVRATSMLPSAAGLNLDFEVWDVLIGFSVVLGLVLGLLTLFWSTTVISLSTFGQALADAIVRLQSSLQPETAPPVEAAAAARPRKKTAPRAKAAAVPSSAKRRRSEPVQPVD